MEPTTQNPPATPPDQAESRSKPLPATERDFRSRVSRTASPGFRIAIIIGVVILLVVGFFVYRYVTSYESTDDAEVDGHINSISARISGHVIKLNVQDNQYVQAGTVLVEIDPADYQVAYERAKADFDDAQAAAAAAGVNVPITSVNTTSQVSATEADVASSRAGIAAARQQYEAAKAQLAQAVANDVKAQNDLGRYRQLVDKQEISQQQYDQAVAASRASAAAVDAARATADAAQQQVTQAQGKLVQAEANLSNARTAPRQMEVTRSRAASALAEAQFKKAELDQAQLNLQYTKVTAPVAGVVSDRTVEVGQNVAPGQELMKVIPLNDVWITANFKETQLREMKVGQPVTVEVDASGRKYKGKVDSLAGASGARFSLLPPENATGNYVKVVQRIPVKIVLDPGENNDQSLRPGMSVEPKVWIRQ
ncbi:MAG TPA: HlyD family secretion protein [Candidatus Acidoferrales bacterium]|jgi:membrane fusion protein (multidrug efflux system)|nr:HlyD family secretion protein [Candidatus Acidoferrales bacterium]